MVSTKVLKGSDGFFAGTFNETQAHSVTDIPGCIAACEADVACVQITWAPSHPDKCVLYSAVTGAYNGGFKGWVKLSGQFLSGPGPSCDKMHLPPADTTCSWFVDFKTSEKHFISNCDEEPTTCGAAQKSCWPHYTKGLPLEKVNATYIESFKTASTNYSCDMSNFAIKAAPPPAPPAIDPAELLRKSFTVSGSVASAIAFVSGVGWMDASINGKEIAPSDRLNPGRTNFDMRQWFMAYNVTELVTTGENAVGILLGRGWQSMVGHTPVARLMLAITTSDGKTEYVVTDETWKGSRDGPIRSNNIYTGEVYDAQMEIASWADAKFDDSKWAATVHVDEFKGSEKIVWQPMNPIRQIELNAPLSITPIKLSTETVHVFKFPQNAAGWSQLTVDNCPKGTKIEMYFSENLCGYGTTRWSPRCADGQLPGEGVTGTVDQRNLHGHWANTYTCKGDGKEVYEPHFMYTGHRYVEVHGFPGDPNADSLKQRVVHSDVEAAPTGEQTVPRRLAGSIAFGTEGGKPEGSAPAVDGALCYEGEGCSATRPAATAPAILDQISHNVRWTLIDNLHSVPEDCDQRNERWGWMADASVSAEGNFQYHWIGSLYTSWLTLMRDVQTEPSAKCAAVKGSGGDNNLVNGKANCTGAVGDLTPGQTPAALPGDPSWMFAYPLVFSYQHRYFGDTRLATTLYPGITAYADFLKRMGDSGTGKTKGLVTWKKYGDWLEPGRVPSLEIIGEMSSGFNYGQTLRIARDTATTLGHTADAAKYDAAHTVLQKVFHAAYWDAKAETYGNGQQAALVYALYLGAVPAAQDAAVFAKLLTSINTVAQPPDHITPKTQQCGKPPCIDTGILATKWLMELLSLRGRTDVGLDLAFQTDYPSWGYMAAMNSTTVWEHWEYMNGPGMNSHNHPALASVGAWLFRWVAGIRLADGTLTAPSDTYGKGWKKALFSPGCVSDARLPSVTARVHTLFGPIMTSWHNTTTALTMSINLPPNTAGTVVIPASIKPEATNVTEGGKTVWKSNKFVSGVAGVMSGKVVDGAVTLEVGSGMYEFSATA